MQVLVENNVHPNTVSQLIFAVFSDMQFDSNYHNAHIFDTAEEAINKKFAEAGLNQSGDNHIVCLIFCFGILEKQVDFQHKVHQKTLLS